MARQRRKFGTAIRIITNKGTGEVEGWVYRWDNGEESRLMKSSIPAALEASPEDTPLPQAST